jgi:hypothetical protein
MVEAPPSLIASPTQVIVALASPNAPSSPNATVPAPTPPLPSTATGTELRQLGIHSPDSLDSLCVEESRRPFVVEGFLTAGSIGIVVGDSGLGKSALIYQLGLSVAAELAWHGMKTRSGSVLYLDLENGALGSQEIRNSSLRGLGLEKCPANFFYTDCITDMAKMKSAIEKVKPVLVVIDTLRSFDPSAEESNTKAGMLMKDLRLLCRKYQVSFILIHHTKKQEQKGFFDAKPNLETDSPMRWLNLANGARALMNQSDLRIGIEETSKGNAALVLRGHRRITGEFGPMYLERIFDDNEQPIAYRKVSGVELLNKEQQAAFEALPAEFAFKDAKATYGRRSQATVDFLHKCIRAGVLVKERGSYQKVPRGEAG